METDFKISKKVFRKKIKFLTEDSIQKLHIMSNNE